MTAKNTEQTTGVLDAQEPGDETTDQATEGNRQDEGDNGDQAEDRAAEDRHDDADDAEQGYGDAEPGPAPVVGFKTATASVVAAGLGIVALSGSWVGKVAAERQALVGQIETSQGGTPTEQISAIYADAWHTTALVDGIFALLALIVGVAVLTLPRKHGWVRAVAAAGAVLGALGLVASAGMYFDLFLALPSTGS